MIWLFLKLVAGHFIADFTFQSDEMAKYKNYRNIFPPPPGHKPVAIWPYGLTAHAATHAAMVYLILPEYPSLAVIEFLVHWVTDFMKCAGFTNLHQDQAIHIAYKLCYVLTVWIYPHTV